LHIPIDFLEGNSGVPKSEIVPPADQEAINLTNHLLNRGRYPSDGHVVYLGARPFQAFLRGNDIQVPAGSMQTAIKPEGKTKEVKTAPHLLQANGSIGRPVLPI
jgi:hypothetical protein